ncbi:hypothetical protein DB43_FE00030 [Parachlamydia acanthamoebae]|uniref:Transposase n=1 Tax=Parachlamydia acanthamoebae TaxID=83552 RepID=A0A0C1CAK7_9BACT|nr:hypothetical protein DB43_FE00030 [Parachlamydia acanthamoebae]
MLSKLFGGNNDHSYPSDISREQFDKIKPMLEPIRKKTHPRSIDLYDVFCGILYILKSSCSSVCYPKSTLNRNYAK